MSDEAQVMDAPSTVLDPVTDTGPSGAGVPRTLPDDGGKEPSLRDTIAASMKEVDAPEPEPKAKDEATPDKPTAEKEAGKEPEGKPEPKDEPKQPVRGTDGKFAAKDPVDPAKEPEAQEKPKDDGQRPAPPARFLPDAKEKWANTPRSVQRDIDTMVREHDAEVSQLREGGQRYEALRQYDETARSNGRDLAESLQQVTQFENLMRSNPVAALQHALLMAGPRKPDGTPLSMYEVAQAIVQQGPEGYQRMMAQPAPQQQAPQESPRVAQLEQTIAQMKQQQVASSVIEPFRAANPRYDELQNDIAFFLQSGRIPASLSLPDRLAAAYDMAVRINPASHVEPAPTDSPDPGRAVPDLSGSKSIKSAPGGVTPDIEPDRGGSIRDLLQDEMRRVRRA